METDVASRYRALLDRRAQLDGAQPRQAEFDLPFEAPAPGR